MLNRDQTCVEQNCDKPVLSKDLCSRHYNQMKKTPEWQERYKHDIWEFVKKELKIQ